MNFNWQWFLRNGDTLFASIATTLTGLHGVGYALPGWYGAAFGIFAVIHNLFLPEPQVVPSAPVKAAQP